MCKGEGVQSAVVVVDPYSSGKYLLVDLSKRGIPIIGVRSSTKMSDQFLRAHDANSQYCVAMLEFEAMGSCLSQLVEAVQALPFEVVAVIPGSEPGVEVANRLSHELALPFTNPVDLIPARTDKAEMQEALRRNGIPAAKQFKSGDIEQLLTWARKGGEWPLVAKPVGGAGSEGVFFCKSEADVEAAYTHIIGNRSSTGAMNEQLALQEFLAGDEYIVDTVSCGGKHLCVAVWVYKKLKGLPWNPNAIMVQQSDLLPASGEKQDELINYVFSVLDAVGLQNGPCHTEVMFTKRGPILVEVNARMHGLHGPRLIEECTGTSKATYTADALACGGELFWQRYHENASGRYLYPVNKQCVMLMLCSPVEGYLEVALEDALNAMELPSVFEVLPVVKKGGYLSQTKDLPTLPGTVLLVHESMQQIETDIQKIRDAELSLKLYNVSAAPAATPASFGSGSNGFGGYGSGGKGACPSQ